MSETTIGLISRVIHELHVVPLEYRIGELEKQIEELRNDLTKSLVSLLSPHDPD